MPYNWDNTISSKKFLTKFIYLEYTEVLAPTLILNDILRLWSVIPVSLYLAKNHCFPNQKCSKENTGC